MLLVLTNAVIMEFVVQMINAHAMTIGEVDLVTIMEVIVLIVCVLQKSHGSTNLIPLDFLKIMQCARDVVLANMIQVSAYAFLDMKAKHASVKHALMIAVVTELASMLVTSDI